MTAAEQQKRMREMAVGGLVTGMHTTVAVARATAATVTLVALLAGSVASVLHDAEGAPEVPRPLVLVSTTDEGPCGDEPCDESAEDPGEGPCGAQPCDESVEDPPGEGPCGAQPCATADVDAKVTEEGDGVDRADTAETPSLPSDPRGEVDPLLDDANEDSRVDGGVRELLASGAPPEVASERGTFPQHRWSLALAALLAGALSMAAAARRWRRRRSTSV